MPDALSNLNFRDLGGLMTSEGRRLRYHRIYRNEGPASYSAEHCAALRALQIRLICDLRGDGERCAAPNLWNDTARLMNFSVADDVRAANARGWHLFREEPNATGASKAIRSNYRTIPVAIHPRLAELVDAVRSGETPVLIHCTAGKDRTGVLVALLLAWLDVPREIIAADYLESVVFAGNLRARDSIAAVLGKTFGLAPDDTTLAVVMGVDREFLDAAFDAVHARWGSVADYFADAGLDREHRRAFGDAMLESI